MTAATEENVAKMKRLVKEDPRITELDYLEDSRTELVTPPRVFPDLAPCGFVLFLLVKRQLKEK